MRDIWKLVIFIFLLAVAVFLAVARFLAVGGIVPNFVFVAFLLFFFRTDAGRHLKPLTLFFLIAVYLALSFIVFRFWFAPAVLLGVIILAVHFLGRRTTGEAFVDFLIALFSGTVVFYGLAAALLHRPLLPLVAGMDFLVTAILGAVLWVLMGLASRGNKSH